MNCSQPGCSRPHHARGLCRVHYEKWRRGTLGEKRCCRDCGTDISERFGNAIPVRGVRSRCEPGTQGPLASGTQERSGVPEEKAGKFTQIEAEDVAYGPGLSCKEQCASQAIRSEKAAPRTPLISPSGESSPGEYQRRIREDPIRRQERNAKRRELARLWRAREERVQRARERRVWGQRAPVVDEFKRARFALIERRLLKRRRELYPGDFE